MQNKGFLIGIGVLVAVALAAFFLMRGGSYAPTQSVPAPGTTGVEETVVVPGGEAMEVREIVIDGDEFSFSPSSIALRAGEKVKLIFNNVGSFPHNFTIEGLGVATKTIGGGKSDTIEFTVEESGTYVTFCSVGNHQAQGMEGNLTAE